MSVKLIFLVLTAALIAHSDAIEFPKCKNNVTSIENYDKTRMVGTWYVVEVGDEFKSKKRCLTGVVTNQNGSLENSVLIKEIGYISGIFDEVDLSISQIENSSQYLTKSNEFGLTTLSIISTDYDTYATWFLCREGHQQGGVIFVTIREKDANAEVLKKAHESITSAGFKIGESYLYPVDQELCYFTHKLQIEIAQKRTKGEQQKY